MVDVNPDTKLEKMAKSIALKAFGTGIFVFGFYLFSPTWLRQTWAAAIPSR